jgi:hypothetical protein
MRIDGLQQQVRPEGLLLQPGQRGFLDRVRRAGLC